MSPEARGLGPDMTVQELQRYVSAWADRVYPNRTPATVILKLVVEAVELLKKPNDPLEYGDLLVLALDLGTLMGVDVIDATVKKIRINDARRWRIDPVTGMMQHIEEGDTQS